MRLALINPAAGPRWRRPDDELLDVIVLEDASRLQLLKFWMRMSAPGGSPLRMEGVRAVQMRELEVRSTSI